MTAALAWFLIGASWTGAVLWAGITIGRVAKARELQVPTADVEPLVVAEKPGLSPQVIDLLARSIARRPLIAGPRTNSGDQR